LGHPQRKNSQYRPLAVDGQPVDAEPVALVPAVGNLEDLGRRVNRGPNISVRVASNIP
jgi:hypothetical protein